MDYAKLERNFISQNLQVYVLPSVISDMHRTVFTHTLTTTSVCVPVKFGTGQTQPQKDA